MRLHEALSISFLAQRKWAVKKYALGMDGKAYILDENGIWKIWLNHPLNGAILSVDGNCPIKVEQAIADDWIPVENPVLQAIADDENSVMELG